MNPDQYCQEKAARSGSSFYYAFLFLPPERRRAITALYAFCREVDDVVDESKESSVARMKLAWWRTQVENLYRGQAEHPVMKALAPHVEPFGIQDRQLYAVIEGMEMDLDQLRYPDWRSLDRYCWRAAGVVGEMSAGIFGPTTPATLEYARQLGTAFQLTNIIRDVGDDARRGRIYLPQEDLDRHGVKASEIMGGLHSERFVSLMRFETARAREHYRAAMHALPENERRAQRPGLMMAAIYATLLDEIERDGWHVLDQRISLTPIRKFWLAWRTWVGGGGSVVRRLSR